MGRLVQTYFRRLDHEETAKNAERLLSDFRHREAKSKRAEVMGLKSPLMDGMPRNDSVENGTETKLIAELSDQEFVQRVRRAIECIESEESRVILRCLYIDRPVTAENIMIRLSMSNTAYYHAKEEALVAFAEVWPPEPSELLAYRTVNNG
ncbi:ArpU family phage packaging/lysis transcriptional regulator [Lacticaseibacillus hegangensis]|uniref:ArpU family phage packaging/lysis transcriptional regulator n=1 Tax=Lacticaseibacillus hegangensis TaxID=2486010 RepID=A0ABW4CWN0_9LACO|nr:ArpU family phage packaging/lysis transcriptional regulator [Lacticaseibacillus hegangensis]